MTWGWAPMAQTWGAATIGGWEDDGHFPSTILLGGSLFLKAPVLTSILYATYIWNHNYLSTHVFPILHCDLHKGKDCILAPLAFPVPVQHRSDSINGHHLICEPSLLNILCQRLVSTLQNAQNTESSQSGGEGRASPTYRPGN